MPFKPVFERTVNTNMQKAESSGSGVLTPDVDDDVDIKKQSCGPDTEDEAQDIEMSEKGIKDRPPRFSTLFAESSFPQFSYDRSPPSKQKRGITITTPVFVVLAITLFLETTLLFAYTVIGLYNNLPPQLGAFNTPGLATSCDCDGQPSINIAPNFYLPSGQGGVDSPLPIQGSPLVDPAPIPGGSVSIISSLTAFPTAFPTGVPLADKAVESHLLSLLEQQLTKPTTSTGKSTATTSETSPSSTKTTTKPTSPVAVAPTPIVTSLKTVSAPTLVTATSIKTLPAPTVTVNTTVGQRAVDSSTQGTTPGSAATSTTTGKPTSTTATTTGDASAESSKTTTSPTSKATFGACFGGSGGAELVCPSGVGRRRRLLRW